jgi:3-phosphoshikimate 1-carboxyvinyltransferase
MQISVSKSQIGGRIKIPPSKSQTMRALIFGAAAKGTSVVRNFLRSDDTDKLIHALTLFGARFEEQEDALLIHGGNLKTPEDIIDVGNSGIALRFLTAFAANILGYTLITGDASIRQRPMNVLLKAYQDLGAFAVSSQGNNLAPIIMKGPFHRNYVEVDGSDSQPVSALMIAAALSKKPLTLIVNPMKEVPFVMMTARWIQDVHIEGNRIQVMPQGLNPFDYTVPGDASTAAFPAALALITESSLEIEGLSPNDGQGDLRFFEIAKQMGADIEWNKTLKIRPTELHGVDVDINDCIDAIAAVSVLACFAKGKTRILNAKGARFKECDRLHVLTQELKKMGAHIREHDDSLEIIGSPLQGATLSSHDDHRMAMAFLVAGMGSSCKTTVQGCACIEKTYPDFAREIQKLGGVLC